MLRSDKSESPKEFDDDERTEINFLLNTFEDLAVGIQCDIYNKKMIEGYLGMDMSRIYNLARPYIEYTRKKHQDDDAWKEFEKLAENIQSHTKLH